MAETTRDEWAKRVERWRDSGLTAKEFASETGLKASTLSYWKWRLSADRRAPSKDAKSGVRRRVAPVAASFPKASGPTFVEVAPPSAPSVGLELVCPHGLVLRVPVGFDEDTLRRTLCVVGALR